MSIIVHIWGAMAVLTLIILIISIFRRDHIVDSIMNIVYDRHTSTREFFATGCQRITDRLDIYIKKKEEPHINSLTYTEISMSEMNLALQNNDQEKFIRALERMGYKRTTSKSKKKKK